MVEVITGNGLGFFNSQSQGLINTQETFGQANLQIAVNAVNGNLLVQRQDQLLINRGADNSILRTYNSLGQFHSHTSNFRFNFSQRLTQVPATDDINQAGSYLIRITSDGYETVFNYDESLGMYISTDGKGAHDSLRYDADNNVWIWTEESSQFQEFYRLDAGEFKLIAGVNAEGQASAYEYDNSGRLVKIIDSVDFDGSIYAQTDDSQVISIVYNSAGQVVRLDTTTPSALEVQVQTVIHYEYHGDKLSAVKVDLSPDDKSISDGNVYATYYEYYAGDNGQISRITQTDGSSIGFSYLTDGRVASVQQNSGVDQRLTHFKYNDLTRTTTIEQVLQGLTQEQPAVYTSQLIYDDSGRLQQSISPANLQGQHIVSSYEYDDDDNLISITDGKQIQQQFEYDSHGNITLEINANNERIERVYGEHNELLSKTITGAQTQLTSHYVYDQQHRLRFSIAADGRVSEFQYHDSNTSAGKIVEYQYMGESYQGPVFGMQYLQDWAAFQLTDVRQSLTRLDFRGQIYSVTQSSQTDKLLVNTIIGDTTYFIYDQNGRLLKTVDSRGEAPSQIAREGSYESLFSYDALGRLLTSSNSANETTTTLYDDINQRIEITSANQLQQSTIYNAAGEVVRVDTVDLNDSAQATNSLRYFYDQLGRVRAVQNEGGALSYQLHDRIGRLIATIDASGTLTENRYDENSNLISTTVYSHFVDQSILSDLASQIASAISENISTLVDNTDPALLLNSWRPEISGENDRSQYFIYDDTNRLRFSVDADGYVNETVYDDIGQVVKTIQHVEAITDLETKFTHLIQTQSEDVTPTDPIQNFPSINQAINDISGLEYSQFELISQMELTTYDYRQQAIEVIQTPEIISVELTVTGASQGGGAFVVWSADAIPTEAQSVWFLTSPAGSNEPFSNQTVAMIIDPRDGDSHHADLSQLTEGDYDYRILYTDTEGQTLRLSEGVLQLQNDTTSINTITFTSVQAISNNVSSEQAVFSGPGWTQETGSGGPIGQLAPQGQQGAQGPQAATDPADEMGSSFLAAGGQGDSIVRWFHQVKADLSYDVYVRYRSGVDKATNAPYTVFHIDEWGQPTFTTITVDQQANGGEWLLLGDFRFAEGQAKVILTNDANGAVSAEAVRFEPQEELAAQPVMVDNESVILSGDTWSDTQTELSGFMGDGYVVAPRGKGNHSAEWQTELDSTQQYEVFVRAFNTHKHQSNHKPSGKHHWWSHHNKHQYAHRQQYFVYHRNHEGQQSVTPVWVDMRHASKDGEWISLGNYYFGSDAKVVINNERRGEVMVDAMHFEPIAAATIILDNKDATFHGEQWEVQSPHFHHWHKHSYHSHKFSHHSSKHSRHSYKHASYIGDDYQLATAGAGDSIATWRQSVSDQQEYHLYARWPANHSHSEAVPFSIKYTDKDGVLQTDTITVNMQDYRHSNEWVYLGTYYFASGLAEISLSNTADGTVAADGIKLEPFKVKEIILDDRDAKLYGKWYGNNRRLKGYLDKGYRIAPPANNERQLRTAEFTTKVSNTTTYKVYAHWTAHKNRATNAPFTIRHLDENGDSTVTTVQVDMSDPATNGEWQLLGEFRFASGETTVTLSNRNTDGFVAVDGLKLTPQIPDEAVDAIIDDRDATLEGSDWSKYTSRGVRGYYGKGYRVAVAGDGSTTATWTHETEAADYKVYARWTSYKTRATDAPYTIIHLDDHGNEVETTIRVNMKDRSLNGEWVYLGTFRFGEDQAKVVLSNDANGTVSADAVRFDLAPPMERLTVNDDQAEFSGEWAINGVGQNGPLADSSTSNPPKGQQGPTGVQGSLPSIDPATLAAGNSYRVAQAGGGESSVEWRTSVSSLTSYNVYARWVASSGNASDAPYTIGHSQGISTVNVDQTQNGSLWMLLGTYHFSTDEAVIRLNNNANGAVIADAIRVVAVSDVSNVADINYVDTANVVDGAVSMLGFLPQELWHYIDYVDAKVYDSTGTNLISQELTRPGIIKDQIGTYSGEVNLKLDGPLADGDYQVVIDIHYLDDRNSTSQIIDYQIENQLGKRYQAFSWDAASYALQNNDHIIFRYRQVGSNGAFINQEVTVNEDGSHYYLLLNNDVITDQAYEYRIEYLNQYGRLLAESDGQFLGGENPVTEQASPYDEQRINIDVRTIRAISNNEADGQGTLLANYLNFTDDTQTDYVDVNQLAYVSVIVRDADGNPVVNNETGHGEEFSIKTYIDPQDIINNTVPTHINISAGSPLADGDYRLTVGLYYLDGSFEEREPFIHQIGLQIPPNKWNISVSGESNEAVMGQLLTDTTKDNYQDRLNKNFYDENGRLFAVLDSENYLTSFNYDASGNVVQTISYAQQQAQLANTDSITIDDIVHTTLEQNVNGQWLRDQRNITLYDAKGRVLATIDDAAYVTLNEYDAVGNIIAVNRFAEHLNMSELDQIIDQQNGVENLRYEHIAGILTSSDDDYKVEREYNALNQVILETDVLGTKTSFVYNKDGQLLESKVSVGAVDERQTLMEYDGFGRVKREYSSFALARAGGDVSSAVRTEHEYDEVGRRKSSTIVNPTGVVASQKTTFYYDANSRLRFSVNALGGVTEIQYNQFGEQLQVIEYAKAMSVYQLYDGGILNSDMSNEFAQLRSVDDKVTQTFYNRRGLVSRVRNAVDVDRNSDSAINVYNPFSEIATTLEIIRSTKDANSKTRSTSFQYDNRGSVIEQTVSDYVVGLLTTSQTKYDAFGRVVQVIDGNNNVSRVDYRGDSAGRRIAISTNAAQQTATVTYDAFDRVVNTTNQSGHSVATKYITDENAGVQRVVSTTNVGGKEFTTEATTNRYGEQVRIVDAEGRESYFNYDAGGNLIKSTNHLGIITYNNYDDLSRLDHKIGEHKNDQGLLVEYYYDALNRVTLQRVDPESLDIRTEFEYDIIGHRAVSREINHHEDGSENHYVTESVFDKNGNQIATIIDPDGLRLATVFDVDSDSNQLRVLQGQLLQSLSDDVTVTELKTKLYEARRSDYSYDALGRRVSEKLDDMNTYYHYDANGNVLLKTTPAGGHIAYVYDNLNQPVYEITEFEANTATVREMNYDQNGRVVKTISFATSLTVNDWYAIDNNTVAALAGDIDDQSVYYFYDEAGRLIHEVDALGYVIEHSYDNVNNLLETKKYENPIDLADIINGDLTSVSNQLTADNHFRVNYQIFDVLNRLRFSIDGEGYVKELQYNERGQLVNSIEWSDAIILGNYTEEQLFALDKGIASESKIILDVLGRTIGIIDAENNTETYQLDELGHQLVLSNAKQVEWHYEYDSAGRMIKELGPEMEVSNLETSTLDSKLDPEILSTVNYDGNVEIVRSGNYVKINIDKSFIKMPLAEVVQEQGTNGASGAQGPSGAQGDSGDEVTYRYQTTEFQLVPYLSGDDNGGVNQTIRVELDGPFGDSLSLHFTDLTKPAGHYSLIARNIYHLPNANSDPIDDTHTYVFSIGNTSRESLTLLMGAMDADFTWQPPTGAVNVRFFIESNEPVTPTSRTEPTGLSLWQDHGELLNLYGDKTINDKSIMVNYHNNYGVHIDNQPFLHNSSINFSANGVDGSQLSGSLEARFLTVHSETTDNLNVLGPNFTTDAHNSDYISKNLLTDGDEITIAGKKYIVGENDRKEVFVFGESEWAATQDVSVNYIGTGSDPSELASLTYEDAFGAKTVHWNNSGIEVTLPELRKQDHNDTGENRIYRIYDLATNNRVGLGEGYGDGYTQGTVEIQNKSLYHGDYEYQVKYYGEDSNGIELFLGEENFTISAVKFNNYMHEVLVREREKLNVNHNEKNYEVWGTDYTELERGIIYSTTSTSPTVGGVVTLNNTEYKVGATNHAMVYSSTDNPHFKMAATEIVDANYLRSEIDTSRPPTLTANISSTNVSWDDDGFNIIVPSSTATNPYGEPVKFSIIDDSNTKVADGLLTANDVHIPVAGYPAGGDHIYTIEYLGMTGGDKYLEFDQKTLVISVVPALKYHYDITVNHRDAINIQLDSPIRATTYQPQIRYNEFINVDNAFDMTNQWVKQADEPWQSTVSSSGPHQYFSSQAQLLDGDRIVLAGTEYFIGLKNNTKVSAFATGDHRKELVNGNFMTEYEHYIFIDELVNNVMSVNQLTQYYESTDGAVPAPVNPAPVLLDELSDGSHRYRYFKYGNANHYTLKAGQDISDGIPGLPTSTETIVKNVGEGSGVVEGTSIIDYTSRGLPIHERVAIGSETIFDNDYFTTQNNGLSGWEDHGSVITYRNSEIISNKNIAVNYQNSKYYIQLNQQVKNDSTVYFHGTGTNNESLSGQLSARLDYVGAASDEIVNVDTYGVEYETIESARITSDIPLKPDNTVTVNGKIYTVGAGAPNESYTPGRVDYLPTQQVTSTFVEEAKPDLSSTSGIVYWNGNNIALKIPPVSAPPGDTAPFFFTVVGSLIQSEYSDDGLGGVTINVPISNPQNLAAGNYSFTVNYYSSDSGGNKGPNGPNSLEDGKDVVGAKGAIGAGKLIRTLTIILTVTKDGKYKHEVIIKERKQTSISFEGNTYQVNISDYIEKDRGFIYTDSTQAPNIGEVLRVNGQDYIYGNSEYGDVYYSTNEPGFRREHTQVVNASLHSVTGTQNTIPAVTAESDGVPLNTSWSGNSLRVAIPTIEETPDVYKNYDTRVRIVDLSNSQVVNNGYSWFGSASTVYTGDPADYIDGVHRYRVEYYGLDQENYNIEKRFHTRYIQLTAKSGLQYVYDVTVAQRKSVTAQKHYSRSNYQPQIRYTTFKDSLVDMPDTIEYTVNYYREGYHTEYTNSEIQRYSLETRDDAYAKEFDYTRVQPEGFAELYVHENSQGFYEADHKLEYPDFYQYKIIYEIDGESYSVDGTLDALLAENDISSTETAVVRSAYHPATQIQYDSLGNVTSRTEALGSSEERTTGYEYDAAGRQTAVVLPVGLEKSITDYDAAGNEVLHTDYLNNISYKVYDLLGRIVYEIDKEDYVTAYEYDAFSNQVSLTRHSQKLDFSNHDRSNPWTIAEVQQALIISDDDRVMNTEYDLLNRKILQAQDEVETLSINSANAQNMGDLVVTQEKPTTAYEYNAYHEVIEQSVYTQSSNVNSLDSFLYYDSRGLLRVEVAAGGHVTQTDYDAAGRAITVTEFANNIELLQPQDETYQTVIDQVNENTEKDRTTQVFYDKLGQLTSQYLNDKLQLSNEYDVVGNVVKVTDAANNETYMYYDQLGRTTAIVAPERQLRTGGHVTKPVTTLEHDLFGNVVRTVHHAQGLTQAVSVDAPPIVTSHENDHIESSIYDSRGHQTDFISTDGIHYQREYDVFGNVLEETFELYVGDAKEQAKTTYSYDKLGRQISQTQQYVNVEGGDDQFATQNIQYNAFGEVSAKGVNENYYEFYEYDNAGRLIRSNQGDGVYRGYGYSLPGYQTAQMLGLDSDYDMETHSLSTVVEDFAALEKANGDNTSTAERGIKHLRMTLNVNDAYGNVLEAHAPHFINQAGDEMDPVTVHEYDRWGNQLSFDAGGSKATQIKHYDDLNRIIQEDRVGVQVMGADGILSNNVTASNHYVYDELGQLLTATDANQHVTSHQYNEAGQLLRQTDATGVSRTSEYDIFGNQTELSANGVDYSYHYDKANRVVQQTTNERSTRYRYDANGKQTHVVIEMPKDQADLVTRNIYNQRGDLIETRLPMHDEGKTVGYLESQLTGFVGGIKSHRIYSKKFQYDDMGNQTEIIDGNGRRKQFQFSDEGYFKRLEERTDLNGIRSTYDYSVSGELRLEQKHTNNWLSNNDTHSYDYYENGLLKEDIISSDIYRYTKDFDGQDDPIHYEEFTGTRSINSSFDYDVYGNRVKEKVVNIHEGVGQNPSTYTVQDNRLTYDSLNRLETIRDSRNGRTLDLAYSYDAVGNRRSITGSFDMGYETKTFENWYTYDDANRVLISQGVMNGQQIELSSGQGRTMTYDNAGRLHSTSSQRLDIFQRKPDFEPVQYAYESTERYTYNGYGELSGLETTQYRDEILRKYHVSERSYDLAGRLIDEKERNLSNDFLVSSHSLKYDRNSRVTTDVKKQYHTSIKDFELNNTAVTYNSSDPAVRNELGYDGEGNVYGYLVSSQYVAYVDNVPKGRSYSISYTNRYNYYDSYAEVSRHGNPVSGTVVDTLQPGTASSQYDSWGNKINWIDSSGPNSQGVLTFYNNTEGKVLERRSTKSSANTMYYYYANGESVGNASRTFREYNFDNQFTPITLLPNTPGQYVVNAGDSLEGIARNVYGDASLWYLIADANSLSIGDDLLQGLTLRIPDAKGMIHNTSDVFKPYNPSKIYGDTTPDLPNVPPPEGPKCAVLAMIVVTIITVAVSAITYGALAGPGATFLASVLGGAVSGVAGNVAGQLTGMVLKTQDGFDWGAVAREGIKGAITGGVGNALGKAGTKVVKREGLNLLGRLSKNIDSKFVKTSLNVAGGLTKNAIGQGVGMVFDKDKKFNWGSLVASGIMAGGVADYLKINQKNNNIIGETLRGTARGTISGGIEYAVNELVDGKGKFDFASIAANAFGDALGSALVDQMEESKQKKEVNKLYRALATHFDKLKEEHPHILKTDEEFFKMSPMLASIDPNNVIGLNVDANSVSSADTKGSFFIFEEELRLIHDALKSGSDLSFNTTKHTAIANLINLYSYDTNMPIGGNIATVAPLHIRTISNKDVRELAKNLSEYSIGDYLPTAMLYRGNESITAINNLADLELGTSFDKVETKLLHGYIKTASDGQFLDLSLFNNLAIKRMLKNYSNVIKDWADEPLPDFSHGPRRLVGGVLVSKFLASVFVGDPVYNANLAAYAKDIPKRFRDEAKALTAFEIITLGPWSKIIKGRKLFKLGTGRRIMGKATSLKHLLNKIVLKKASHAPSGISVKKFDGLVNEFAALPSKGKGFAKWKKGLVDEGLTPTQIQEAIYQGTLKRGDNLWKKDWKRYYEEITGTTFPGKPWHAHHLVEKGSSSAAAITNRKILREVGIDPMLSRENLTWARTSIGQHGSVPQKTLLELLQPVRGSHEGVVHVLRQWAEIAKAK